MTASAVRLAKSQMALVLDLLLAVDFCAIAFIAITGGGSWKVGPVHLRATSVANPVVFAVLLIAIRYAIRSWRLHWGLTRSVQIDALPDRVTEGARRIARGLDTASPRTLTLVLLSVVAASVILRVANVLMHPGFLTGDDVELHEMTLGAIFAADWPIWNLRSPLYPMGVLYPAQRLAASAGISDVGVLINVGRFVVLTVATVTLWLVYRIGRELSGRAAGVLALLLFASSRLHLHYGSSELPRPVASVFILGAFLLLVRPSRARAVAAGIALGLGGSLRFGEFVFLLPAAILLARERRWFETAIVGTVAAATALLLIGASDTLYWGTAFSSIRNAYQFTIVERQSSRGFEPPWFYLASAASWSNYLVVGLSLYSFRCPDRRASVWAWIPIVVLSCLPHKEARYLIAAQPFVCLSAALAAQRLFERFGAARSGSRAAAALVTVLIAAVVLELGDWRVRRSDRAVTIARGLASIHPQSVAAQQLWKLGGHLYFRGVPRVVELDDDISAAVGSIRRDRFEWVLVRREWIGEHVELLREQGYEPTPSADPEYLVCRRQTPQAATR